MKKNVLRAIAAIIAALLATVVLTVCLGNQTKTQESTTDAVLSSSTAEAATPMTKFDFPKGRIVEIATWDNFPDTYCTSYIFQDVVTDNCYLYTIYSEIHGYPGAGGCTITPLYDGNELLSLRQ